MESSFSPRETVSELDKFIIGQKKTVTRVASAEALMIISFWAPTPLSLKALKVRAKWLSKFLETNSLKDLAK